MNVLFHYSVKLLIPSTILLHLIASPYTKVEESFNIQAVHDILFYGVPLKDSQKSLSENYDHANFPGAVPRSFIGALVLAGISNPLRIMATKPEHLQSIVRGVLGLLNAAALLSFEQAVSQAFGITAGYFFILFQIGQFHIMYYASRTLPNMFAFGLSTVALRFFILSAFGGARKRASRCRICLSLLTSAGVIFRSELAIMVATLTISYLLVQKVPLRSVVMPTGIGSAVASLMLTVLVDSFFWQRIPVWPEWVAFRYNTIEGNASSWGTSPWHFYFTNALPRLMMNPMLLLILLPIAMALKGTRRFSLDLLTPLIAFIGIYSLMPHKEWRFIIYTVPAFNAVAAAGASCIWSRRHKSIWFSLLSIALVGSILFSAATSLGIMAISSLNYPGASALEQLKEISSESTKNNTVHLDNLSCQTGVTRFLQHDNLSASKSGTATGSWKYDKSEDAQTLGDARFWHGMDFAILENPESAIGQWKVAGVVDGFVRVDFVNGQGFLSVVTARLVEMIGPKRPVMLSQITNAEERISRAVAGGKWPRIKMTPRLYIMRHDL